MATLALSAEGAALLAEAGLQPALEGWWKAAGGVLSVAGGMVPAWVRAGWGGGGYEAWGIKSGGGGGSGGVWGGGGVGRRG